MANTTSAATQTTVVPILNMDPWEASGTHIVPRSNTGAYRYGSIRAECCKELY